jgi:hypothetical protein
LGILRKISMHFKKTFPLLCAKDGEAEAEQRDVGRPV